MSSEKEKLIIDRATHEQLSNQIANDFDEMAASYDDEDLHKVIIISAFSNFIRAEGYELGIYTSEFEKVAADKAAERLPYAVNEHARQAIREGFDATTQLAQLSGRMEFTDISKGEALNPHTALVTLAHSDLIVSANKAIAGTDEDPQIVADMLMAIDVAKALIQARREDLIKNNPSLKSFEL